jgi:hypothetical protein
METQTEAAVTVPTAIAGDPLLAEAYRAAAEKNVLRALNPNVFFGYFSVCADGKGHGHNTTYPGLDWGLSAEALLWLGRREEVLASWEYVKGFQRDDGLVPFAILPDNAGTTSMVNGRYPVTLGSRLDKRQIKGCMAGLACDISEAWQDQSEWMLRAGGITSRRGESSGGRSLRTCGTMSISLNCSRRWRSGTGWSCMRTRSWATTTIS